APLPQQGAGRATEHLPMKVCPQGERSVKRVAVQEQRLVGVGPALEPLRVQRGPGPLQGHASRDDLEHHVMDRVWLRGHLLSEQPNGGRRGRWPLGRRGAGRALTAGEKSKTPQEQNVPRHVTSSQGRASTPAGFPLALLPNRGQTLATEGVVTTGPPAVKS